MVKLERVTRFGLVGGLLLLRKMYRWLMMDAQQNNDLDKYFSMNMIGLSNFFGRLDPLVDAGVTFSIVNQGIMVSAFIPESQLTHMLVRSEW